MEQNDYRFSTLVLEIVNSKPFQMRTGESGGKGNLALAGETGVKQ
jgi:hypothetical protein